MTRCERCGTADREINHATGLNLHLCVSCFNKATKPNTKTKVTKKAKQSQRKGPSLRDSRSSPFTPHPSCHSEGTVAEVDHLLGQFESGDIKPEELPEVPMTPIPDGLTPAAQRVAEFFLLVTRLRAWTGDDRPPMFGCDWTAAKLGMASKSVWRARKQLVAAGWIEHAGRLPGRGKLGTDVFALVVPAEGNVVPLRRAS